MHRARQWLHRLERRRGVPKHAPELHRRFGVGKLHLRGRPAVYHHRAHLFRLHARNVREGFRGLLLRVRPHAVRKRHLRGDGRVGNLLHQRVHGRGKAVRDGGN